MEEEKEALVAIYGADKVTFNANQRIYSIAIEKPPSSASTLNELNGALSSFSQKFLAHGKDDTSLLLKDPSHIATVHFELPSDYPSCVNGPSCWIESNWVDKQTKEELAEAIASFHDPGSTTLFQCIEYLRERIVSLWRDCEMRNATDDEDARTAIETVEDFQNDTPSVPNSLLNDTLLPYIHHGIEITDRKSIFQGHAAVVTSLSQVKQVYSSLLSIPKIARATHNILAYRLWLPNSVLQHESTYTAPSPRAYTSSSDEQTSTAKNPKKKNRESFSSSSNTADTHHYVQDHNSDGETAAGGRLQYLLVTLSIRNAVVIVSRWYGGKKLGADRFKHISNAARSALEAAGLLIEKSSKSKKA